MQEQEKVITMATKAEGVTLKKAHYVVAACCGIAMLIVLGSSLNASGTVYDHSLYMKGMACCIATYLISKVLLLGDK